LQFIGGTFDTYFEINSLSVSELSGANAVFCEFACEVDI
jgi:hypothetical protein